MAHFNDSEAHKVLLVDDDTTLLELFGSFLQSAGYEVETAESGIEGIRKFRNNRAHVVITDRSMPHMDGEQMTEVIKSINPDVPVILITGLPENIRHSGLFTAVLPKPFRSIALLSLVENALTAQSTPML